MTSQEPMPILLSDYRPPGWLIDSVRLEFDLRPDTTRVKARLACRRNPAADDDQAPLILDGDELSLKALKVNGGEIADSDYVLDDRSLRLAGLPESAEVEIETEIDPAANTKLEGLYLSNGNFCTQCEAEGFRRITFFSDRPDVMATYHVTIRAERAAFPVLLSNGNLMESGDLDGGRHYAIWHDPFPKPSYLFALVAGNLAVVEDHFSTASGRDVTLRIYVEHGNEDRCGYAMDTLKRAMRWDEERYGLEYDLDLFNIVAVSDFNMGAMENKSLNIFNSKYVLANPDTATDQDYAFIESIIAHEYFHNWTGNRVTCRDWFQLSLKEGLTVFRDQQFSADMRSEAVARIKDVRALRARQFPEDSGPLAHPVRPASYIEINNFYTATVYEKGAEVIRMLHRLLGEEGFQRGMRQYFERHDGAAATCDDFVAAMADANDVDLTQFKRWYSQAGTPVVTVKSQYDPEREILDLSLRQETPPTPGQAAKDALHLPLEIGLLDAAGNALPIKLDDAEDSTEMSRNLELTKREQNFRFHGIKSPPLISLNRGFTAPIKLAQELDRPERALLMAHDGDLLNRFEAGQRLATELLLDRVSVAEADHSEASFYVYIDALGACLGDGDLDDAFRAELLALPSEDYLGEQMAVVDVEAIHQAREALRRIAATKLQTELLSVYRSKQSNTPYRPDAASAGRRALKNRALWYLAARSDAASMSLLVGQYQTADNMTDRMAALALLNDIAGSAREDAMDDFFARYQDDPLVLDKWFQLQATSALPETLERVKALLQHDKFSLTNPNRVRALIGAFANQNPLRFHAEDGAGYEFLVDQILELDWKNPQVAARLATVLGRWQRFGPPRRDAMRQALERIFSRVGMSRDLFEIVDKSLSQ